jgi:hypothetical protein
MSLPSHGLGRSSPAAGVHIGAARLALLLCAGALLTSALGCRANMAPVLNVVDAPVAPVGVPGAPGAAARAQGTVRVAILQALAAKTWTVDEERMGLILATVQTPPHFGQIAITYNDGAYSIYHRGSSPTLKYDGQIIHRRYNNWIAQLRKTIDAQLANSLSSGPSLGPGPPASPGPGSRTAGPPPPGTAWAPAPGPAGWPAPAAPAGPAVPVGSAAPGGGRGWPAPNPPTNAAPTPVPAVPPRAIPPAPPVPAW